MDSWEKLRQHFLTIRTSSYWIGQLEWTFGMPESARTVILWLCYRT
jgi:hypothetical protein